MKTVKYLLIPVVCLMLCVIMILPICAFTSSENATPIESFFEGIFMMLFVIMAALIPFAVPILIGAVVLVTIAVIVVIAIKKKRKKSSNTNQI